MLNELFVNQNCFFFCSEYVLTTVNYHFLADNSRFQQTLSAKFSNQSETGRWRHWHSTLTKNRYWTSGKVGSEGFLTNSLAEMCRFHSKNHFFGRENRRKPVFALKRSSTNGVLWETCRIVIFQYSVPITTNFSVKNKLFRSNLVENRVSKIFVP